MENFYIIKVIGILYAIFTFSYPQSTNIIQPINGIIATTTEPIVIEISQKSPAVANFIQDTVSNGPEVAQNPPSVSEIQYVPVYITPVTITQQEPILPQIAQSQPIKMQTAKIEIKNPLPRKGLGRDLKYRSEPLDEVSTINIGAVLYNPDGSVNNTAEMVITTTDVSQDKTLQGTGDISTFGDINHPKEYYAFMYDIKTSGLHKITFTALGVSEEVSINVTEEDTR